MKVAGDAALLLEDVPTTEEVPTPIVTLDSDNRQKFFDFPNPKASTERASAKSACMDQIITLEKTHPRRVKKKPKSKDDFHAHKYKHYGFLLSLPLEVKGFIKKESKESRGGS